MSALETKQEKQPNCSDWGNLAYVWQCILPVADLNGTHPGVGNFSDFMLDNELL